MTKDIETILITGILELGEKSDKLNESITDSFKTAINLILQSNEVFYQIPERIYVSMDRFEKIENDCGSIIGLSKDIETNFGIQNDSMIDYFNEEGVILFEGIAAAAFGRMSYIYRSKGIRIYLFKNSILKVVTPYSTIDHNGFQLHQEESFEMILDDVNNKNIEDIFWFTKKDINNKDELRFYSPEIIRILTEIKKPFNRNYFLEYLLTPPDVDELSNFSINIKNAIWDLCLSEEFENKWGQEFQSKGMNLLSSIGLSPTNDQLIKFIKRFSTKPNYEKLIERFNQLETNLVKESNSAKLNEDIIDIKPNFFGLGFNFNALFKLIKRLWNKKND